MTNQLITLTYGHDFEDFIGDNEQVRRALDVAEKARTTALDAEVVAELLTRHHHSRRHGIISGYNSGCRGPLCRLAHSKYKAERSGRDFSEPLWDTDRVATERAAQWIKALDKHQNEPLEATFVAMKVL